MRMSLPSGMTGHLGTPRVLGGAPAGHRRRPATKLGVRAGLGVGGAGRGARVGGGAPAGRAGGGKGRNLVLLPVLVRADHPSGGRMGLSATAPTATYLEF